MRFSSRSDSFHSSLRLGDVVHTACPACLYLLSPKSGFPGKIHPLRMYCLCCPGSSILSTVVSLVFYFLRASELKKSNSPKNGNSREHALEAHVLGNSTEYSIQSFKSNDSQSAPQYSFLLPQGRVHSSLSLTIQLGASWSYSAQFGCDLLGIHNLTRSKEGGSYSHLLL